MTNKERERQTEKRQSEFINTVKSHTSKNTKFYNNSLIRENGITKYVTKTEKNIFYSFIFSL